MDAGDYLQTGDGFQGQHSSKRLASKDIKWLQEEEEAEESTTSTKKQRMIDDDDNGDDDSSSTDDLSSEMKEEVSLKDEMNLRRPRSDDGATSYSEKNDGDTPDIIDTSDDGDTSDDAFD
jgi:hypothetical protein